MKHTTPEEKLANWMKYGDPSIKALLASMPKEEQRAAFEHDLSFGTAGLRGIMGVGTSKINIHTIALVSQGIAQYLQKLGIQGPVLIGYDTRHHSLEFAQMAAEVFSGNSFPVLLLSSYASVALISFGVLYHQCCCGVLITCSHNPPQYNGYKVFWNNGGQVTAPHDQGILEEIATLDADLSKIKRSNKMIHSITTETQEAYYKAIHFPNPRITHREQLKILYSPLHGSGKELMVNGLNSWGFTSIDRVLPQSTYDGDFPFAPLPNPEEPSALALGISLLKEKHYDLFLATDPDVDRLGAVFLHDTQPITLSGNQIGALLVEYLLTTRPLPPHPACIKTVVTTELFTAICKKHRVACFNVLTGFKYIGEQISQWEQTHEYQFIFGCEESYGYLFSDYARDKDAIIAGCLLAELALSLKQQSRSLQEALYSLFQEYGIFQEHTTTLTTAIPFMEHKEGVKERLLSTFPVSAIEDYTIQERKEYPSQITTHIALPCSPMLIVWLEDETKLVLRPSGTEPKIKLYCGATCSYSSTRPIEEQVSTLDLRCTVYLQHLSSLYSSVS